MAQIVKTRTQVFDVIAQTLADTYGDAKVYRARRAGSAEVIVMEMADKIFHIPVTDKRTDGKFKDDEIIAIYSKTKTTQEEINDKLNEISNALKTHKSAIVKLQKQINKGE